MSCPNCATLSHQLVSAQQHVRVLAEEVSVLRCAQVDCSNMANDIYVYQQCVEAQRVELARAAGVKDVDVGVMEMLQQLSMLQTKNDAELRKRSKEQVRALKEQLHQLTLRVTTLSAEHPDKVDAGELVYLRERVVALEENVCTQVAMRKHAEAEKVAAFADRDRLSVCVDEQRRHMAALAQHPTCVYPDTGIMSLMESVRQQAAVEFRAVAAQQMRGLQAELQRVNDLAKTQRQEIDAMREVIETLRKEAESKPPCPPSQDILDKVEKLEKVEEQNQHLRALLDTVTARESKYASDIQILNAEAEVSATRVRTMVQRHLQDRAEMQRKLEGVTEHRVALQRDVCRIGVEKQTVEARLREVEAELEFGKRITAAFKDMQEVFGKHNLFQTSMKQEAANHTAKMLELECTREALSPQSKSKRKSKKA